MSPRKKTWPSQCCLLCDGGVFERSFFWHSSLRICDISFPARRRLQSRPSSRHLRAAGIPSSALWRLLWCPVMPDRVCVWTVANHQAENAVVEGRGSNRAEGRADASHKPRQATNVDQSRPSGGVEIQPAQSRGLNANDCFCFRTPQV